MSLVIAVMICAGIFAAGLFFDFMEGLLSDRRRLDWLDRQVEKVIDGQSWGNPYGEWVANSWRLEGPFCDLRTAIDGESK